MAVFSVDSDEMQTAVAGTRASMDAVTSEVAALLARLTSLQSSWSGGAASQFQYVVDDWRGAQQRVEESMTLIGTALGTAADSYGGVEQDVQRMFAA